MDDTTEPPSASDSPGRSISGHAPRDGVVIEITGASGMLTPSEDQKLSEAADALAGLLAQQPIRGEARVRIVGDDEMSARHAQHLGDPSTTDVLTFDLSPEDDQFLDADILVCANEAKRRAQEFGHDVPSELMLYIVHAILHCTGYDDKGDTGARGSVAMHEREDEILRALGLGSVYHAQHSEHES